MKMETLQKLKEGATILSLVAVPVIVAWGTQVIQNRITEEGTRKDYVTIAIGILTKKKDEQPDIELRQWAVDVVDKNSPVKLPDGLKARLSSGGIRFTSFPVYYGNGVVGFGGAVEADDKARIELKNAIEDAKKKESEKGH